MFWYTHTHDVVLVSLFKNGILVLTTSINFNVKLCSLVTVKDIDRFILLFFSFHFKLCPVLILLRVIVTDAELSHKDTTIQLNRTFSKNRSNDNIKVMLLCFWFQVEVFNAHTIHLTRFEWLNWTHGGQSQMVFVFAKCFYLRSHKIPTFIKCFQGSATFCSIEARLRVERTLSNFSNSTTK